MSKTSSFALIGVLLFGLIEYSNGQNISNQLKTKIEEQVDSLFHENIIAAEHLEYDQLSKGVDDIHQAGFIVNGSYFAQYDSLMNSPVSYTHLRAHETRHDLVCRLLLE